MVVSNILSLFSTAAVVNLASSTVYFAFADFVTGGFVVGAIEVPSSDTAGNVDGISTSGSVAPKTTPTSVVTVEG